VDKRREGRRKVGRKANLKEKEGNRNRWFGRNNCTSGEVGGK
jgi:hypothetical protein